MRRVIFAALVGALQAMSAWSAAAQDSQTQTFTLKGRAPAVCSISPAQSTQAANMTLASGFASQHIIGITSLANSKTAQLQQASISLVMTGLCNHAHSLMIASANGGLILQTGSNTAVRTGFANRVDYTAQVSWASKLMSLRTAGLSGGAAPAAVALGAFKRKLPD